MPYLIDTDWIIDYLSDDDAALALLENLAGEGIAISMVTYMEIYQGVERSPDPDDAHRKVEAFLESVPIIPFSLEVARRCASLREGLRKQGKRVGSRALDLVIPATALQHDLTLVTRNVADYDDIPDLRLYRPD